MVKRRIRKIKRKNMMIKREMKKGRERRNYEKQEGR